MHSILPVIAAVVIAFSSSTPIYAQSSLQKAQNLATCLSGRYPSLCKHDWLSSSERQEVEVAERRQNLATCLNGRYPSLCNRSKLTAEERERVLSAEKRENLRVCMTGQYRTLCKKNMLTEPELRQVLVAERTVNLNTCLIGLYASLCDHSLLSSEQLAQVQVAEKKAADARRTYAASPRRAITGRARSSSCEDGHWIDSVSSGGEIIKLEDGSIWEVDSVDAVTSSIWLPVSEIVVCDGKLINTDDNESVEARRIR